MDVAQVLGVDACKVGWVGVALGGAVPTAYFAETIDDVVAQAHAAHPLAVVAVDIPIGLPDEGRRQADELARKAVGGLSSSVYITPVRKALEEDDHAAAVETNRGITGEGVSVQAFGVRARVYEVERWVEQTDHHVVEVHPEVSFATMAETPLTARKGTWTGCRHRHELLAESGISLPSDLGTAGTKAAVDDILDAAAAAWTAQRVHRGTAQSLPDPPERFSDGLPAAIRV
ncbi:putative RNase H-like nuclease [Halopolyspora algeriensis]|uniref:Putative RNase H-like nuclease n=1 Tax=Halopolyspora algeriensis TaxID=1500506 RepID=A0A368VJM6_9ACTN|nr:DUF429 domain-containing protein [Halopolyspora algeriensis]RCW40712.1 putative RNase H-like nuclease [Halopolyspora algeriensis]TQM53365.1 putative RNase H-like nuclease [Halopolyspora algeriensis]